MGIFSAQRDFESIYGIVCAVLAAFKTCRVSYSNFRGFTGMAKDKRAFEGAGARSTRLGNAELAEES